MVPPTFCLETSFPRLSHSLCSYFSQASALNLPLERPFLITLSKRTIPTRHSQSLFSALFFFIALISTSQYLYLLINHLTQWSLISMMVLSTVVSLCTEEDLHNKVLRAYLWNGQLKELWIHSCKYPHMQTYLKKKAGESLP